MTATCIFGGSFDPPHATHRRIVETALATLKPRRLLVVPCATHALKDRPLSPAEHRIAMCRLAFAGLPQVEVSDLETGRGGTSFTVDTVRQIRAEIGLDDPLWVLVGSDNLPELDRWHDHHSLLELATLVVFPRKGAPIHEKALRGTSLRLKHKNELIDNALDMPADAVSSTALRDAIARGQSPRDIAPEVIAYAREHGLYAAGAAEA